MRIAAGRVLSRVGLSIIRSELLTELDRLRRLDVIMGLANRYSEVDARTLFGIASESQSQLLQDCFALCATNFREEGYFVEFGALDGVRLSNTLLLEEKFSWRGILVEPLPIYADALHRNRKSIVDSRCVWSRSGEQLFLTSPKDAALTTVSGTVPLAGGRSLPARNRLAHGRRSRRYVSTSVSLEDLLKEYEAPKRIDFMSVDVEGAELEILEAFDFSQWKFDSIAVEHNFGADRQRINALLVGNGYRRVLEEVSCWDDWYIPAR